MDSFLLLHNISVREDAFIVKAFARLTTSFNRCLIVTVQYIAFCVYLYGEEIELAIQLFPVLPSCNLLLTLWMF